MRDNRFFLFKTVLIALLLAWAASPAGADFYSWTDTEGIVNFSNSRESAPPGAKVEVWPESPAGPSPKSRSEAEPGRSSPDAVRQTEVNTPRRAEAPLNASPEATPVTQGRFVFLLEQELGLGRDTTEEAADLLTRIRVAPPLGRWELEAPITPALATRLRCAVSQGILISGGTVGRSGRGPVAAVARNSSVCCRPYCF